jgi:hypothetical protein
MTNSATAGSASDLILGEREDDLVGPDETNRSSRDRPLTLAPEMTVLEYELRDLSLGVNEEGDDMTEVVAV